MAATAKWYGQAILQAFGSETSGNAPNIDFLSDTIKVMLTTSVYTPDQDAHVFKSSVTNEVASGGGYTTGGATLTTKTAGYTGASNLIWFKADNVVWTAATFTTRYAVIYDSTPATDATRPLLGWVDFGADQSPAGVDFQITWDASGLLTVTPA